MAKDRKNRKSLRVPKRIAGVKVPKEIRKPVNRALKMADDPKARDLAVAGLTAAAAALTARPDGGEAHRPRRPGEPGTDGRAGTLADVLIAAALDGARRFLDGIETPAAQPSGAAEKPKRARASAGPAAARPAGARPGP
jgi:hypothetical protein